MFEEYTYEKLLDEVLDKAPDEIDKRQGSIFYDSVSGILLKIAKLYTDLDLMFNLVFIDTATGEFLDKKAFEYGLERLAATGCCYYVVFEGETPEEGERFFTNGLYFTLKKNKDNIYYLQAEEKGTSGNNVFKGTKATPVNNIQGLTSAVFGDIMETGADEETDISLRTRIREKIGGPAENGNKQHYKTWCESVEGVGRAKIIPLWNGPNTVKGVIINSEGLPADEALIEKVQEYVDPGGEGLGEGAANLGAHFTAVSAEKKEINIRFTVELKSGETLEEVKEQVSGEITKYLKELTLKDERDVKIFQIGYIINALVSDYNYESLTLNGKSKNIELTEEQAAVLGEVIIDVL